MVVSGLAALVALAGCMTEEKIKKANGYYQEGLAFLQTDRQRAFLSLQRSVQVNPAHKDAHYYLGHLYAIQEKYKEAENEFREALRIDPDYSDAENYLGQIYETQGRWRDAIAAYRRALTNPLYVTPDVAGFNLGRALAHEGDQEGATRAFEDALRVSPPSVPPAWVHLELGRAYYRLGYQTKAKEALLRVTSLNKGGPYGTEAEKLLERMTP
jgi:tetratricopeptide (TPR) repeat protein